jgi:hypothetical protein
MTKSLNGDAVYINLSSNFSWGLRRIQKNTKFNFGPYLIGLKPYLTCLKAVRSGKIKPIISLSHKMLCKYPKSVKSVKSVVKIRVLRVLRG